VPQPAPDFSQAPPAKPDARLPATPTALPVVALPPAAALSATEQGWLGLRGSAQMGQRALIAQEVPVGRALSKRGIAAKVPRGHVEQRAA